MTKLRFPILILAILTAAVLCACGDTTAASSAPEGINTFGFEINPSTQPSVGQTVDGDENPPVQASEQPPSYSAGPVIEGDTPTSIAPSDNPATEPTDTQTQPTSRPTSSPGGNGGGNGGNSTTPSNSSSPSASPSGTDPSVAPDAPPGSSSSPDDTPVSPRPSGSDDPVTSPSISPPAPVSSATIEEASKYIGKPLSVLIADLGYPYNSEYEDVVEGDPNTDRVGTLYFTGYIVTTLRTEDGETVTSVVPN